MVGLSGRLRYGIMTKKTKLFQDIENILKSGDSYLKISNRIADKTGLPGSMVQQIIAVKNWGSYGIIRDIKLEMYRFAPNINSPENFAKYKFVGGRRYERGKVSHVSKFVAQGAANGLRRQGYRAIVMQVRKTNRAKFEPGLWIVYRRKP